MTHHNGTLALAALIGALALSGCGSSGQDTAALALTPVPQGKARVTIKRESALFAAACPAAITAGAQKVADIGNGGQAIFDIPAGNTSISASCWSLPGQYAVKFKAEAGRNYALAVGPRSEAIAPAVAFGIVGGLIDAGINENAGAFQIKDAASGATPVPVAAKTQ
jgi:hypothetical protein